MAKGARASTIKANNAALKSKVFGPVEDARTQRLSAKLLALAAQPKPERPKDDADMEAAAEEDAVEDAVEDNKQSDEMEVDQIPSSKAKGGKSGKGRIERKRSSRKASIVFPKYKKGNRVSKSRGKK